MAREIINHRSLRHPNIIRFKEVRNLNFLEFSLRLKFIMLTFSLGCGIQVVLTPTHLAIVMEYAAGGELFERICNAGRFSEDEVLQLLFATHLVS